MIMYDIIMLVLLLAIGIPIVGIIWKIFRKL